MTDLISRRKTLRALAQLAAGGGALTSLIRPAAAASPATSPDLMSLLPESAVTPGTLLMRTGATPAAQQLATSLSATARRLDPQALLLAAQALDAARLRPGMLDAMPGVMAVIDYSLPSTEKRLWVFDLKLRRLLYEEWVAHGRNSGDNMTVRFSNEVDSHMSSLGAYVAGAPYTGKNGYSLRLRGLEPGFNDRAFERAIVMHGAPYVNPDIIRTQGRLGRSWGCPAMRADVTRPVIDLLAQGGFLFNYFPDQDWLAQSRLIGGMAQLRA
ncbi:murein L,D-transpeptidase catalytic domain family protein [Comamonadaceae bacterium PP-2]